EPPDLAVHLFLLHLFVGEGGEAAGAPVDDVLAPVNQPLFMQPHEDFAHSAREILVEREVGTSPVGAGAQGPELLQDDIAGFPHEGPDSRFELTPAEVEAG